MQKESNWRYYFIVFVTAICLLFIMPTLRFMQFEMSEAPPEGEADFEQYQEKRAELQQGAIGLGLDLLGGVDVLLQINRDKTRADRLESLAVNIRKELRDKTINGRVSVTDAGDALEISLSDNAEAQQVVNILRDRGYAGRDAFFADFDAESFRQTGNLRLRLSESHLSEYIAQSLEGAERSIRRRVNTFGLTQPSISRQNEQNAIRVQVPGAENPERVIDEIIRPAQLEFYVLHDMHSDQNIPDEQNPEVLNLVEFETVTDPNGNEREIIKVAEGERLPTGYKLMRGEIARQRENASGLDYDVVPYIVKTRPEMTGKNLADARVQTNPQSLSSPHMVALTFNNQGAREFARVTSQYQGDRLAIALDGVIYSAPRIRTAITDGQAVIEGTFSFEEARDLSLVLKAGALPADLRVIEKRSVGPTLGQDSINESVKALAIGAVVITAFMLIYYGTAGFISILALILNVLVILACLDMFNATLTLSGIGGIILTLGMAVDANVLIYERIREELRNGRDIRNAIHSGFGQAFSVIFDSNLTTLLTALVLLQFGEGTVRGFALTMAFGLIANLFTGLTVTYALCRLWFNLRGKLSMGKLTMFADPKINFIGIRKFSLTLSAIVFVCAIGYLGVNRGPNMAVDFRGGVITEMRLADEANVTAEDISRAIVSSGDAEAQAKVQKIRGGVGNDYIVRMALQDAPEGFVGSDTTYTESVLEESLQAAFADQGLQILGTTGVSAEVGQGFQMIALQVIILASICILAYLWFRFELVFGVAAVIALIHDLTITLGIITLLGVQVSLDIVSALLILLGLSVNDTIVIFDRVRENSHTMFGRSFKEICNAAMNRCLSRTIITSVTTVGIMLIMYLFGGHSLQPFALTLIVGGIIGTYSSSFVATPIVFIWNARQKGKLVEHLGRKAVETGTPEKPAPGTARPAEALAGGTGSAPGNPPATSDSPRRRRGRR